MRHETHRFRTACLPCRPGGERRRAAGQRGRRAEHGKPANQFVACFVAAQNQAAQPWSFVPRDNGGGTFSNLGASGVTSPYFLRVADRGSRRDIRLEATEASSGASVLRAVDRCV